MKQKIIYSLIVLAFILPGRAISQNINWNSLDKNQKHLINLNAGAEYGLIFGAGYGFKLPTKIPAVINFEFSMPSGDQLGDDFKTKIGGSVRLYEVNDFQFTAKVQGVFRRYENPFATLVNFGSDMSGIIGYYQPKWFVAGEAGFDKAIVTHFKHTNAYKENFAAVKDGWYEPATGGNFYYGLQTGFSFGSNDITLKGGKIIHQDFSSKPLLPFYCQLGYNIRLN